ncbi:MAG: hypothetical protein RR324_09845 [Cellulosilyticaceae bacterium]|uniref:hypothetical protein n=1 Tax=Niameybacter sp. TaxID=2033640 RepID=UPI002FCB8813
MKSARVVGCNIENLISTKGIDRESFVECLDYSMADLNRILEGRLVLTPLDLREAITE